MQYMYSPMAEIWCIPRPDTGITSYQTNIKKAVYTTRAYITDTKFHSEKHKQTTTPNGTSK